MRNMHPADELALIRSDLRRLKEREAFLRKGFLEMRHSPRGDEAVATVKILKKRQLRQDRLPPHVLENADYWETRIVRHVQVDPVASIARHTAPSFLEDDRYELRSTPHDVASSEDTAELPTLGYEETRRAAGE